MCKEMTALICVLGAVSLTGKAYAESTLAIVCSKAGKRYITYAGKPLLAFGPGDENRLISASNLDGVARWAKWQQANGMNLVRAYPTAVPIEGCLHPFKLTNGKWDVDAWNDDYFANLSRVISIIERHGIIVHLQLWQIVYFKEDKPERWARNYVNPANNCNAWTRAYPHGRDYMNAPPDSPAGKHRKDYVMRVLGALAGHGNVWIDVVNELSNGGIGDMAWAREVVKWIRQWEKANGQKLLVGVDMCNFDARQFAQFQGDYDLLVFNELHRDEALRAIGQFHKPAVSVRSSDGSNNRDDYMFLDRETATPAHQTRYRTLCYRSIFSGLQSIGAYWKPEVSEADYAEMSDWPLYARSLRAFWGKVGPFWPELAVDDSIAQGAVTPCSYGLKSDRLCCVYLECGPHAAGNAYPPSTLKIDCPFERFRVELFSPRTGKWTSAEGARAGGRIEARLPGFTEDLVAIVWNAGSMDRTQ